MLPAHLPDEKTRAGVGDQSRAHGCRPARRRAQRLEFGLATRTDSCTRWCAARAWPMPNRHRSSRTFFPQRSGARSSFDPMLRLPVGMRGGIRAIRFAASLAACCRAPEAPRGTGGCAQTGTDRRGEQALDIGWYFDPIRRETSRAVRCRHLRPPPSESRR